MAASIARVLERLGIEAKRSGREWVARCPSPDHEDRTPSWRIRDEPDSEKHGFHRCWPCGFQGGLVGLAMTVLRVDAAGARAWLREDGDVERKEPAPSTVALRVARAAKFRLPDDVEFGPVETWPAPPRRYLLGRGVTPFQVGRWGIGYAVDGRLGGRIVFPYRDRTGQPRGYTARTYANHPKRYKEPNAKERPDPGAVFGEQHWTHGYERERVCVTEGALNALAVERAMSSVPGAPAPLANVAAIAGSSLRPIHAAKLATFAQVVVLTDPDDAGDKAAATIADVLGRHTRLVRVSLPAGKDAADMEPTDLRARILELLDARR